MTKLLPFTPVEKLFHAALICKFFSPAGEHRLAEAQSLPPGQGLRPLSLFDCFKWIKETTTIDPYARLERMLEITSTLERAGLLMGFDGAHLTKRYIFLKQLTKRQKQGIFWLASALGADVTAELLGEVVVRLGGTDRHGDERTGSGVLIDDRRILTCAHNIMDMTSRSEAFVATRLCKIESRQIVSETLDIGVIKLAEPQKVSGDIALRDARLLEPVLVCGFPPVPRALNPVLTFHSGEVNGFASQTMDGAPALLLSAITRPGNSGGPVVSRDGQIVGIVTRDLARRAEAGELTAPFPFFTALPSGAIRDACAAAGIAVPWEDFA